MSGDPWIRIDGEIWRIDAEIWWCGDETCDCTVAQIIRVTPLPGWPLRGATREVLWRGEFVTCTYELDAGEFEARLTAPLREACARLGVPVPQRYAAARD